MQRMTFIASVCKGGLAFYGNMYTRINIFVLCINYCKILFSSIGFYSIDPKLGVVGIALHWRCLYIKNWLCSSTKR